MNLQRTGVFLQAIANARAVIDHIDQLNLSPSGQTLRRYVISDLGQALTQISNRQPELRIFIRKSRHQLWQMKDKISKDVPLDEAIQLFAQISKRSASFIRLLVKLNQWASRQADVLRNPPSLNSSSDRPLKRALADLEREMSLLQNEMKFLLGNLRNIQTDSAPVTTREEAQLFTVTLISELQDLAKEIR